MESKSQPPKIARWLLNKMSEYENTYLFSGDLYENYKRIISENGLFKAKLWYWSQVIFSIIPYLELKIQWNFFMFLNNVKIALRKLNRHKNFSFITTTGLSIGMAACLILFLYIHYEFNYDQFHANKDRIFQIFKETKHEEDLLYYRTNTPGLLSEKLKNELPFIKSSTRIAESKHVTMKNEVENMLRYEEKYFYQDKIFFADPSIFDVFTFPLLEGDAKTALEAPFCMVMSEKIVPKYFGSETPIGKTILLDNQFQKYPFTITGVMKEIPENSSLQFNCLCSMSCIDSVVSYGIPTLNSSTYGFFHTYFLTKENTFSVEQVELINKALKKYAKFNPDSTSYSGYVVKPFYKNRHYEMANGKLVSNDRFKKLKLLLVIAFLILLIACINYMNLSTAKSVIGTKEIGIRKVIGAYKNQLFKQFLTETVLISTLAFLGAFVILLGIFPYLNSIFNLNFSLASLIDWPLIISFLGLILFVGFLAGSYPSYYLSSFAPMDIFRKFKRTGSSHFSLRKGLVIFQFIISLVLIITTLVFYRQTNYLRNEQLGVNMEQILVVPLRGSWFQSDKHIIFRDKVKKHSGVLNASLSSAFPSEKIGGLSLRYWWENCGLEDKKELMDDRKCSMLPIQIDYQFFDTFNIKLISGRNFSIKHNEDNSASYILNETALKKIGWQDNPIGRIFHSAWASYKPGRVIGIVEDFSFKPIHEKIEPIVFSLGGYKYLSVKLHPNNISDVIKSVENHWNSLAPNRPFDYFFLDDHFDNLYRTELYFKKLYLLSSILTIFISGLGILGLVLFSAEQRTKEIGIRKTYGASLKNIVLLFSKDFIVLVALANLIAWPIAYYFLNEWLKNYPYRINLGLSNFLMAGIFILIITITIVCFQVIKAAKINPTKSLRHE